MNPCFKGIIRVLEGLSTHPPSLELVMSATMSQRIASLKNLIIEIESDAQKSDNGNKAAGVRVRKALLEAVNQIKDARKASLEGRTENE